MVRVSCELTLEGLGGQPPTRPPAQQQKGTAGMAAAHITCLTHKCEDATARTLNPAVWEITLVFHWGSPRFPRAGGSLPLLVNSSGGKGSF